jgi:hypothetical protein
MQVVLHLYVGSRALDGQSFDKKPRRDGRGGRRSNVGRTQNSMDWERTMGV